MSDQVQEEQSQSQSQSQSQPPPLWFACETDDLPLLIEALATATVDERSPNEAYTPLMVAANRSSLRVVDYLIRQGADVNAQSDGGETALMLAARAKDEQAAVNTMTLLLAAAADPNLVSGGGNSPLMEAAYAGHATAILLLVQAGANVNHTNQYGETALLVGSLKMGTVAAVKALLAAGSDPKHEDKDGVTAADVARQHNSAVYEFLAAAAAAAATT
jgi:ankyrin repeat protein